MSRYDRLPWRGALIQIAAVAAVGMAGWWLGW
jgi:hypothetical protein